MYDEVFSPSFGNRPSFLVGRSQLLSQLEQGLQSRPGSRERTVVVLGQRGSGKTVLLWELADRIAFGRKCLMNVASAAKFSSDRTIRQYAEEIWHIKPTEY